MAEIQWGLLQQPDFFGNALRGQAAGRQQASINALRGYQADPQGTISALIGAGDVQSASALANLQYQQQQRDLLAKGAQAFFGGGSPAAPNATPSAPTSAEPAAQPDQPAQVDPAAAAKRLEVFDTTARGLLSMPYEQRKAALAQAAPNLAANGLPEDAIRNFDPTDEGLNGLLQQVSALGDKIGGAPQAAPTDPAVPAPAPSGAPAPAPPVAAQPTGAPAEGMNVYDPATQRALGLMTLGSPQIGGALTALGAAVAPKFGGGERPGSAIIDQHTGKITGFAPTADGLQIVSDGHGGWTTTKVPGFQDAEAGYQGDLAAAKSRGEHRASAPYELITVERPDGSKVQMTLDQFKALKGSGGVPSLGISQTPGDAASQKLDGENFAKEVDAHGAPAIMGLQNARTVTEQAIHLAQTIKPNAGTPLMGQLANAVNAATGGKIGAKDANQISTYQALLPQVMRGTFTTFPRLDKEFHIISQASASAATPKDAASIVLATQAATQARNLAYANFVANYGGQQSKGALTKAWLQTPQAQQSLFADPIWRGLQINGKPAVQVGTQPYKDGHVYGVFMPGTPQAQAFRVQ